PKSKVQSPHPSHLTEGEGMRSVARNGGRLQIENCKLKIDRGAVCAAAVVPGESAETTGPGPPSFIAHPSSLIRLKLQFSIFNSHSRVGIVEIFDLSLQAEQAKQERGAKMKQS